MNDLAHEAEACRQLWLAVAERAIVDSACAIVRRHAELDAAVSKEMGYFRSRSWREVCQYAGISFRPDHIERFFRSEHVRSNAARMREALGLGRLA